MIIVRVMGLAVWLGLWASGPRAAEQPTEASSPVQRAETTAEPAFPLTQVVPISTPHPRYPPDALQECAQGVVNIRFKVGRDGQVSELRLLNHVSPSIDRAVEQTVVTLWRFQPFSEDDPAPYQWVSTRLEFRIPDCDEAEADATDTTKSGASEP